MSVSDILKGKQILVVDDEPEILEIVSEQLIDSDVTTAHDFQAAKKFILDRRFDLVLLDIMGVNGFELLKLSGQRDIPAAMLTSHAINVESLNKSVQLGAVSFLPKDDLYRLPELVVEILEGLEEGRSHWKKLFDRLGPFFKERLGVSWEDLEKPGSPPYAY